MHPEISIHPTATVAASATIGRQTTIWHLAQIREDVVIGEQCIIAKNVYIDFGVRVGSRVKIQNNCSIYHGAVIEDGAFLGPHVVLTNDALPRSITPDGQLKKEGDWAVSGVRILYGASLGASVTVLPGVTIGRWALVGAGSTVRADVPDHAVVIGNQSRVIGYICKCGKQRATAPRELTCICMLAADSPASTEA
ncbi:MAG: acetyltransferase [Chloroflexi bacterium]|nr:acetyltransferase [Chloroflexota bacterium]